MASHPLLRVVGAWYLVLFDRRRSSSPTLYTCTCLGLLRHRIYPRLRFMIPKILLSIDERIIYFLTL